MTKFADMNPPPWETTATSGRADLRLHPLIREAYKVACLIEDCGGSPELTAASGAAFSLCEQLSDYFRQQAPRGHRQEDFASVRRGNTLTSRYSPDRCRYG